MHKILTPHNTTPTITNRTNLPNETNELPISIATYYTTKQIQTLFVRKLRTSENPDAGNSNPVPVLPTAFQINALSPKEFVLIIYKEFSI